MEEVVSRQSQVGATMNPVSVCRFAQPVIQSLNFPRCEAEHFWPAHHITAL